MIGRMETPSDLLDLLRCPACRGDLVLEAPERLICADCANEYGVHGGLPWLFRDRVGSRGQWAAKLQQFRQETLAELATFREALERDDLLDSTRERLIRQKDGLEGQAEQIFALLEPLALRESEVGSGLPRDRIPSAQHVTSYLDTAYRDWCWGEEEVRETMALLSPMLGEIEGDVLVCGGGAGRLAFEVAHANAKARVVQLDVNPLLSSIALRVTSGAECVLNELPRLPLGVEDACVAQPLAIPGEGDEAEQASNPVGRGRLAYILGDAFAPPFADECFDLLITPWFVDIVPEPFPMLARRLARQLRPGGRWINFGPTSFEAQAVADRLTPEEMVEQLESRGFEVLAAGTETLSYLHSPHAMPRRGEEVFAFHAIRPAALEPVEDMLVHPEWMLDARLPIPLDPIFETLRAERTFDVEILKCIDGRAGIEDLVVILSSRYGLAPDRCRATIERFFVRLVEVDGKLRR